jgi:hypothetical protein
MHPVPSGEHDRPDNEARDRADDETWQAKLDHREWCRRRVGAQSNSQTGDGSEPPDACCSEDSRTHNER